MKAKGNDKLILELKSQVEAKKKLLKGSGKFSPKTNCSLYLEGERHNLNVISKDILLLLLGKLQGIRASLKEIYPDEVLVLSGYSIDLWIDDLRGRFSVLNKQLEEQRLKALEEKLHTLLSTDTKISLELEDLKSQI